MKEFLKRHFEVIMNLILPTLFILYSLIDYHFKINQRTIHNRILLSVIGVVIFTLIQIIVLVLLRKKYGKTNHYINAFLFGINFWVLSFAVVLNAVRYQVTMNFSVIEFIKMLGISIPFGLFVGMIVGKKNTSCED